VFVSINFCLFEWRLFKICSVGLGMFSDKSTISFLERVQVEKPKSAWLQCRKDYAVYLQNDGKVYIFFPSSFPWRKADMYNVMGQGE
jgi:hypothetical protein